MTASDSTRVMNDFCDDFEENKLFCSCNVTEKNIEFCVSLRQNVEKTGSKIVVNDRIRNLNKESVIIPIRGLFEHFNLIEIIGFEGAKVLSKKEAQILAQKSLPPETRTIIPEMASGPLEYTLAPEEYLKSEYYLDDFFELEPMVDYKISFGRKIDLSNQSNEKNIVTVFGSFRIEDK